VGSPDEGLSSSDLKSFRSRSQKMGLCDPVSVGGTLTRVIEGENEQRRPTRRSHACTRVRFGRSTSFGGRFASAEGHGVCPAPGGVVCDEVSVDRASEREAIA